MPYRTAQRWVAQYRLFGLAALARKKRQNRGKPWLSVVIDDYSRAVTSMPGSGHFCWRFTTVVNVPRRR